MSEQDAAGKPAEGAETTAAQDTGSTAKPDAGDKGSTAKPAGEDKGGKEAKPGILDGKDFTIGLPGGGTKTVKGDQPMEDRRAHPLPHFGDCREVRESGIVPAVAFGNDLSKPERAEASDR